MLGADGPEDHTLASQGGFVREHHPACLSAQVSQGKWIDPPVRPAAGSPSRSPDHSPARFANSFTDRFTGFSQPIRRFVVSRFIRSLAAESAGAFAGLIRR
ncbi:hypothetical protein ACFQX6_36050 [Streptosporangium lutulentum]